MPPRARTRGAARGAASKPRYVVASVLLKTVALTGVSYTYRGRPRKVVSTPPTIKHLSEYVSFMICCMVLMIFIPM